MSTFNGYLELDLNVEYSAVGASGDNWHEPYEPAHIEIERVLLGSVDVMNMLNEDQLDVLEGQIEDWLTAMAEDALESKAEMLYYERHGE
jgi:hypothetical protein